MTGRFRVVRLLLIVPYLALIWVPFYNRALPAFAGIPFFYWYQLLWIPLSAAVLGVVYLAERSA
ncbi:MAG TPA: DUF3311 domain-containing protein [Rhizomicrobium sp.]|nr:DUF3311 domain-containing protein [Rhizomicrobium sp.]